MNIHDDNLKLMSEIFRTHECWGCGEGRPRDCLEQVHYRDGPCEEIAFYCLDNEVCQRRSESLKRWVR